MGPTCQSPSLIVKMTLWRRSGEMVYIDSPVDTDTYPQVWPGASLLGSVRSMRDRDMRTALASTIAASLRDSDHVLVPEVEIRWSIPARIDALLVNDRISGFEIKSDVDSLARLPRQAEAYGAVVERAHLVVGPRHQVAATALVPDWWSIWTAAWNGSDVSIRQVRRGRLNPGVNPLAVTSFLSRADLTTALRQVGERQLSSKSVDTLRALLLGRVGPRGTLALARSSMLARVDWRNKSLTSALAHPEAPLPIPSPTSRSSGGSGVGLRSSCRRR